jgi:DNA-binding response OmpR family regulator
LAARSARDRATTLPRSAPVPRRATRASAWSKYTLDLPKRQLLDPIGKDVALTSGEFDILKTFAENPNRPLSRDWLLETTSHRSRDPFDRAIDLRITRIRRKIEPTPDKPTVIRTVRGVGYMFVPPAE